MDCNDAFDFDFNWFVWVVCLCFDLLNWFTLTVCWFIVLYYLMLAFRYWWFVVFNLLVLLFFDVCLCGGFGSRFTRLFGLVIWFVWLLVCKLINCVVLEFVVDCLWMFIFVLCSLTLSVVLCLFSLCCFSFAATFFSLCFMCYLFAVYFVLGLACCFGLMLLTCGLTWFVNWLLVVWLF